MTLSLPDIEWLKDRFVAIETRLARIEQALRIEEGVKTDRPADANESKWR